MGTMNHVCLRLRILRASAGCLKCESVVPANLVRHMRLPSPLVGEGARATSAFTRVFDALWRGRVRGHGANETAKPLTRLAPFVRSPPSPTKRAFTPVFDGLWGEGKTEQAAIVVTTSENLVA